LWLFFFGFWSFRSPVHDKLLQIFLTIDDGSDGVTDKGLQGVRRAQIILGTTYILGNAPHYAKQIQEEIADESQKRLWGLLQELQNVSNREFWEVSERGTNFIFLTPEQKQQLPVFFSWFKNFFAEEVPWDPVETKKFARQQALLNFK
jgi:hypothetical protein